jgi:hypothetical protein
VRRNVVVDADSGDDITGDCDERRNTESGVHRDDTAVDVDRIGVGHDIPLFFGGRIRPL